MQTLGPADLLEVRVIAMDEFAIQKGDRYATVVVEPSRKRMLLIWQTLLSDTAYQVTVAPSLDDFVLAGDQDREANATVTGRLRSQGLGSASCRHCGGTVGKQRIDEVGHSLCCWRIGGS